MDLSLLRKIGLTAEQAKTYALLLQAGSLSPLELSKLGKENRTAAYMSLAKLADLGLAVRDEKSKRVTYRPAHPSKLEQIVEAQVKRSKDTKDKLYEALPDILTCYYENSDKPGIRFYEGQDALKRIYEDHLHDKQDVYFVRTEADEAFFGDELYEYMQKRAAAGIVAHGLAPASPGAQAYAEKHDSALRREMTWYSPDCYTAPVEISIYGTKIAFISFGKEAIASIIESPQISQAMRELFVMAQIGASKKAPL